MYYDLCKLLSLKDINGNTPELYLVVSNRSDGKTTAFAKWFVKRFLNYGEKFCLFYRFKNELSNVVENFFTPTIQNFFPGISPHEEKRKKGLYVELFINNKPCGYAVALNSADKLKKCSAAFNDVERILMDEFLTDMYCPNELAKFFSVHTSIARGVGKQYRYVPVYMCANPNTILNPYFVALGIHERITKNTHFLRGDGFILDYHVNEYAAEAQQKSAFNKAFSNDITIRLSTTAEFINDVDTFIETASRIIKSVCVIKYKDKFYNVCVMSNNLLYVRDINDINCRCRFAGSKEDFNTEYILPINSNIVTALKRNFQNGQVRFKNLLCKSAFINLIGMQSIM